MSLEHQMPVLMKKTQMSGDQGQCGLTSLLPMSCRGRAEAFARSLHTRLRNLGTPQDPAESSWLTASPPAQPESAVQRRNPHAERDSDLFFDFELECESPSSPVDEYDAPFPDRSPSDEVPFYDVDAEPNHVEEKKQNGKPHTNGFVFSTAFYSERSPVKSQPAPRENGTSDGRLFSAISFEDCARHETAAVNGIDEVDCTARLSPPKDMTRIPLPLSSIDSDSDFESAKSDPSDGIDEALESLQELTDACEDRLSLIESEPILPEDITPIENVETQTNDSENEIHSGNNIETVTSEVLEEKELSPSLVPDREILTEDVEVAEEVTEEDDRPQRVRRCSSLKTGKTPPGTPGRKKIVRFADVLGLDLADVKTFMDEIPVIPKSAYEDLVDADLALNSPPASRAVPRPGALTLVPLFQLPRDTTELLQARCVCLESARVAEGAHVTVCGSVRVRNLDFHKTVHVRFTMDRWKTYTDLPATYVPGTCDGFSDRFQFVLYAPCIVAGQRLEIAVRFQCKGCQYWDNNCGINYCFDCLPLGAAPLPTIQCQVVSSPTGASPLHPTLDWHPSFY